MEPVLLAQQVVTEKSLSLLRRDREVWMKDALAEKGIDVARLFVVGTSDSVRATVGVALKQSSLSRGSDGGMRLRRLLPLLLATLVAVPPARAGDRRTVVFDGVTLLHRTDDQPKWDIHVLIVDLTKAGVGLAGTPYAQRMKRTSEMGLALNAQAAINGDFRNLSSGANLPEGLTISGGRQWPGTADNRFRGTLAWSRDLTQVDLQPSGPVVTKTDWMRGLISGHPTVLSNGVVGSWPAGSFCALRQPRTGVGLSADKRTLYLAVVDGRQAGSVGMGCAELGRLLKDVGANDGLNLDGGGSTTMWLRGQGVVNSPSDGSERVVVNHLLLYANPAPAQAGNGVLRGRVHQEGNPMSLVTGAKVKLNTGEQALSNSNGVFRLSVPAGTYTGTVTAAGYQRATFTATVTAGNTTVSPVAMKPQTGPADRDFDGVPDASDNCPNTENSDQLDTDADLIGDRCDSDDDGDNFFDEDDSCPLLANADQRDTDRDGAGDACDGDDDGDGFLDAEDNCPLVTNVDQKDTDRDGTGDACSTDRDGDNSPDALDNCPDVSNIDQRDTDGDGAGDDCDPDDDGDELADTIDNCPLVDNTDQADTDRDGTGDLCDPDIDNDGVPNEKDNCPDIANADQADLCSDDSPVPPVPPDPDDGPDGGMPVDGGETVVSVPVGGCSCNGTPLTLVALLGALMGRSRRRPQPPLDRIGTKPTSASCRV